MKTITLSYNINDEVWIKGEYKACYIDSIVIDDSGITYNWVNYDYGVDVTEVWNEGYFTSKDINVTVFNSLEELEQAFPEDFCFEEDI